MRPSTRHMKDVAIKHLTNCLITNADITAADDIFRPNLGSLKGKTMYHPVQHVTGYTVPVPQEIIKLHKHLSLVIDIMFVNKIPFLLTRSQKLKFATVEPLPNCQELTVHSTLSTVLRLY